MRPDTTMNDYGVEDFTNQEEVSLGYSKKLQHYTNLLNGLRQQLLNRFDEVAKGGKNLDNVIDDFILEYHDNQTLAPPKMKLHQSTSKRASRELSNHSSIQNWFYFPALISFIIYCIVSPYLGFTIALLLWLVLFCIFIGILLSWYQRFIEFWYIFVRLMTTIFISGLALLGIATWYMKFNWLIVLGGLFLVSIASIILPLFLQWLATRS